MRFALLSAVRIAIAVLVYLPLWPPQTSAQARKADTSRSEQTVGSWLLTCAADPMTDRQACRLRAKLWLVVPSDDRPGMALEVQLRAGHLVPVVTVRNLSLSTAWSGLLALTATAQIRFDSAPMAELPCMLDAAAVVCAPANADVSRLADELADSRTVLVRFRPVGNLPMPVADGRFDGPWALDLDHTQEALARYRAAGPEIPTKPSSLTLDLRDALDQLLRDLGVAGTPPEPVVPR